MLSIQWQIQDFPLGGANLLGGTDLQHICFSAKTHAETKELDPVGRGVHTGSAPLDPPMQLLWQLTCA